jgi:zinc transport system substrate-binding protein
MVFVFVFVIGVFFAFAQESKSKLEVVTTLFPTYDFAKQIGKDKINVSLLLPPGVESHTFEPKPQDVVRINKADIFIYTGQYMEPWAEDLLRGVSNKKLTVVDSSLGIELMVDDDHNEEGEHHDEGDDHEKEHVEDHEYGHHYHGGKDPHIWVDLANDQIMVDTIAKALAEKDPVNSAF